MGCLWGTQRRYFLLLLRQISFPPLPAHGPLHFRTIQSWHFFSPLVPLSHRMIVTALRSPHLLAQSDGLLSREANRMLNQYLAKAARGYISITPLAVWVSAFEIRIKGARDMMEHLANSISVVEEGTPPMHTELPFPQSHSEGTICDCWSSRSIFQVPHRSLTC